jgi:NADPH:quinone reductase
MTAHRCLFADGPVEGRTVLVAGGAGAVGHFAIQLARGEAAAEIRAAAPGGVDRIVEVALTSNLGLDLAVAAPNAAIATYVEEATRPSLPVRELMVRNLVLRFVLVYTVPDAALRQAAEDITAALVRGAFTELPAHRFALDEIAAAHDAVQGGAVGKVLVDL